MIYFRKWLFSTILSVKKGNNFFVNVKKVWPKMSCQTDWQTCNYNERKKIVFALLKILLDLLSTQKQVIVANLAKSSFKPVSNHWHCILYFYLMFETFPLVTNRK